MTDDRFARLRAGDLREAARLMRELDDRTAEGRQLLRRLHPYTGRAHIIGVTGAPGAGKSTLIDQLIAHYRRLGQRVGVVAVDPSSPFSGGAILGDRIRMQRHATDDGVFIRSLATRGHLGGLSRSAMDVAAVLDAIGFDRLLVETVGVGQDEVDIVRLAHTAVVVTVPGLGDDVQALKAGILEIADVLVVNKRDREGADRAARDLLGMLELRPPGSPDVEIVSTDAVRGEGIEELAAAIERHRVGLGDEERGRARDRERAKAYLLEILEERFQRAIEERLEGRGGIGAFADRVVAKRVDPYTAADEVAREVLRLADDSNAPSDGE